MNKIILFDLGGVLLKQMNYHDLYSKLKCKISYYNFLKYWCTDKTVLDAHKGIISDDEHISNLLAYSKSNISLKQFYEIYSNLRGQFYKDTIDVIKLLKQKNYKIGLLSNLRLMDYQGCKREIKSLNFDYLFLSYKIGYLKPDKEMYNYVIETCKCNPNNIIFFDDFIDNVKGAKDCGINAFLATGDNIKAAISTVLINYK